MLMTCLKTIFRLYNETVCHTGFRAAIAALFALICCLREFRLSSNANRFEKACQSLQILLLQKLPFFRSTSKENSNVCMILDNSGVSA